MLAHLKDLEPNGAWHLLASRLPVGIWRIRCMSVFPSTKGSGISTDVAVAYSAGMDIVLSFLPWKLVWSLQMKLKEKIGVAVAMSLGVL